MVTAAMHHDVPANDDTALLELRTFDVGGHTPLVGSYERFGGNQPGPLLFYLLAAPYRLLGASTAGMAIGALMLTLIGVGGVVHISYRRGGIALAAWSGLILEVVLFARGTAELSSPWEPMVLTSGFALLIFLVWELSAGTWWALPVAAGVASLLAQAWIAYGVFVAVLATLAIGFAIAAWRAGPRRDGRAIRALIATGAVLIVVWFPPLVEQLTHDPGNISELASLRNQAGPKVGLVDGYRAVAIELGWDAPWWRGKVPTPPFSPTVRFDAAPTVPVALIAFVVGSLLATRARHAGRRGST